MNIRSVHVQPKSKVETKWSPFIEQQVPFNLLQRRQLEMMEAKGRNVIAGRLE